jgi:hypothetical protein
VYIEVHVFYIGALFERAYQKMANFGNRCISRCFYTTHSAKTHRLRKCKNIAKYIELKFSVCAMVTTVK